MTLRDTVKATASTDDATSPTLGRVARSATGALVLLASATTDDRDVSATVSHEET